MFKRLLPLISLLLICSIISMDQPVFAAAAVAPTDIAFGPPVTLTVSIPGTSAIKAIADVDGDGHLDIILDDTTSFAILYGIGDGTFTSVTYTGPSTGTNISIVTINDFNNDGLKDLAFCGADGNVYVYMSSGPRTFHTPIAYMAHTSPRGITSADFNHDGYPDIATANGGSSDMSVLINDGTGAFNTAVNYGVGQFPKSVIAADLRNNGTIDLIDSNHYQDWSPIFFGNGTGIFNYIGGGPVTGGGNLAVADFNNDGFIDIAGTNYWGGKLGIAINDGTGYFPSSNVYTTSEYPSNIFTGDLNGDGSQDIAIGHQGSSVFAIYLNDGTGNVISPQIVSTSAGDVHTAAIGDFNEDGKPDIVVDGWENHLMFYYNSTIPLIASAFVTPSAPNGQHGWYTVPVTITLDKSSPNYTADQLSLYYSINDGATQTYSIPYVIPVEGRYRFKYWVESPTGATSVPKPLLIKIDQTPPVTTPSVNGTMTGSNYTGDVSITLTASDNTNGSGVGVTHYTIDSGATQDYTSAFNIADPGSHTVTYWSVDNAGNTESAQSVTFTIKSPPTITLLSPSSVPGEKTFTLTVNGTSFVSGSIIKFSGTNMTTTFVSSTQLTATINKYYTTLSSYPGSAAVSVLNPDGDRSPAATVTITQPVLAPTITSLSPSTVSGSKTFTLTVNGTNFVSGSIIKFNGTNMTTTYVSATQLTASINKYYTTLSSYPGSATISILNPDGGRSTGATLTITAPLPAISSLSPSSVPGKKTFTLTVNGSNFVSGSIIKFNGTNMTTTFVSSTQLTASVNMYYTTLSSYPGSATVTVLNPDGGRSAGATLTITAPVMPPTITSLSPDSITGATAFTLTVNGTDFQSGAVIKWNGTNMPTTYVSSTQLTATVNKYYDTLASYPGSATISVLNPDSGRSAGATLTITAP